jgi:hypothetical protein
MLTLNVFAFALIGLIGFTALASLLVWPQHRKSAEQSPLFRGTERILRTDQSLMAGCA